MRPLPAGQAWLNTHPQALDAILAAGALVCMVIGSFADPQGHHGPLWATRTPGALSLVLVVLGAAALVFRRRAPMTVLAVTGAVSLVELICDEPRAPVAMSAVVALYTVASTTDRPTTWRVGLLTGVVLTGAAMLAGSWPWYAQENIGLFGWTGMAAAAGDAVRSRRAYVHAIQERAERAERTREEEARRRVAEERLRIARDLHDVVAHHIALVNVQAGVAAHVMDKRPDQAKAALAHVREASRSALGELRATVGLLRQSGDPEAPTEPAPGLDRLDELVETFRQAGLPVAVSLPRGVPGPGGDVAARTPTDPAGTPGRTGGTGKSCKSGKYGKYGKEPPGGLSSHSSGTSAAPASRPKATDSQNADGRGADGRGADGGNANGENLNGRDSDGRAARGVPGHGGSSGPVDRSGAADDVSGGLPAAVDLAAYRIIQEALTNVRKHAGAGAAAEVAVVRVGDHIEVTVLDSGPGAQPSAQRAAEPGQRQDGLGQVTETLLTRVSGENGDGAAGAGHGLIGMRERAAALGGSCTAGARHGGGFRVHAILPLDTRTDPTGKAIGDRA